MIPDPAPRFLGCLLGLAVGDALGTSVEFQPPGTFEPVQEMRGGGPFNLEPGQWTDDTSMALCLAESLIECQEFDPRDQMERYLLWYQQGHLSSNGACFDIGGTVRAALEHYQATLEPFSGSTDPHSAGNGSLMRLAPVPMAYASNPLQAIQQSGHSSRTTHAAAAAVDACRYFGALLVGALAGVSKDILLSASFSPAPGCWDEQPLDGKIDEIARGSFKERQPPQIRGSGYVVNALEAALWAFYNSRDFAEGCLMAVNLGDDADTTAAIYGQLAGAYYGEAGIPERWREMVARPDLIRSYALSLFELSRGRFASK